MVFLKYTKFKKAEEFVKKLLKSQPNRFAASHDRLFDGVNSTENSFTSDIQAVLGCSGQEHI